MRTATGRTRLQYVFWLTGKRLTGAVVTEADNWSWSFGNLPKYKNGRQIVYAVAEDAVTNYTPEVNGYDVTNHYTPGKTSVSVTKVWKDNDDQRMASVRSPLL